MTDFSVEYRPITFVFDSIVDLNGNSGDLAAHLADLANPHEVDAAQAGADPAGLAAGLMAAHTTLADVHKQTAVSRLSAISVTEAESLVYESNEIIKVKDVFDPINSMTHNLIYYYSPTSTASVDHFEVLSVANPLGRLLLIDTCACNVFTRNNEDYFEGNNVEDQLQEAGLAIYEITQDTALNNFEITETIIAGVWTVTITQTEGANLLFNLTRIRYESTGPSMSVNATALAGTDANPKDVFVYVTNSGSTPILVASNTAPEGSLPHIDCRLYLAGSVSTSSRKEFTCLSEVLTSEGSLTAIWHTMLEAGIQYRSGIGYAATATALSIDAGEVRAVWRILPTQSVAVSSGFFFTEYDGTFISDKTDFAFTNYSDGGVIGAQKFYSVTFGLSMNEPTNLMALVQGEPGTEYISAAQALADAQNKRVTKPSVSQKVLSLSFLPVCRVVLKNDTADELQLIDGQYAFPIESGTGGSSESSLPAHAATHTNGTDDIQLATATQKGLMSAPYAEAVDVLNSRVDQDVKTTGSPDFAALRIVPDGPLQPPAVVLSGPLCQFYVDLFAPAFHASSVDIGAGGYLNLDSVAIFGIETVLTGGANSLATAAAITAAIAAAGSGLTATATVIAPGDWIAKAATKTVSGITATNIVFPGPDPTSADAWATAGILVTGQDTDELSFSCKTVPTVSINVNIAYQ